MKPLTGQVFLLRVFAVCSLAFAASTARAADDVTMKMDARPDAAAANQIQFNVSGTSGRYDHADATQISIPMSLQATMSADAEDRKIVASVVFLKTADKSQVSAFDGTEPEADLTLEKTFVLPIDAKARVSQDAIGACNAKFTGGAKGTSVAIATVSVPVTWRVTTGKFNFSWRNYDRVAPSEDFVKNPDFYAERKAFERERTFEIKVGCTPLTPQPVARNPAPPPVTPAATPAVAAPAAVPVPQPVAAPVPPPAAAAAAATSSGAAPKSDMLPIKAIPSEPAAPAAPPAATTQDKDAKPGAITPAMAASVSYTASAKKPICNGGSIRQIHSGPDAFLCLCPGETARVETGDNAYSCQKKR